MNPDSVESAAEYNLLSGPAPCFYFARCGRHSVIEKVGKALCPVCAAQATGREYALREPGAAPVYATKREAAEALEMVEEPDEDPEGYIFRPEAETGPRSRHHAHH